MIKNFDDLLELAQEKEPKRVSVAMAAEKEVLLSIKNAKELGIAIPILVGNKEEIEEIAKDIDFDLSDVEIIDESDKVEGTRKAVELVSSGKADVLMKGFVDTPIIMRQVLDKEIGLRTGNIISHIVGFDIETYHKIFFVTDAAMNIAPSLEHKKGIIENAVKVVHSLGIDKPKVGIVAANEKVSENMPATVDAAELVKMYEAGEIKECIVDGPFALDNAISKKAAEQKGVKGEVAGDVDVILVPNIESGNILYKSLTFLGNAKSAGIITGTKAPIILTSRADDQEAKTNSIALAVLLASN